ncbi:hypothetical protein E1218_31915 [Kribbella turkmenica]|uniref:UDP-N-acetylglucosamine kinase n=1 Tax=Kribbella turkmenica TaxID=2530375 RepID=A0A4R4WFW2_9ACTN|nr:hypothetical protein [Kribbella turkmenica]TDD15173.1 hypothetical protein E1218_31915 [Kribbella turkmenica]
MPRALLLSGGGGAGKTTIAQAVGRLLTADHHPTAVLDLDAVAQFGPAGPAGPALSWRPVVGHLRFHDQLKVHNLAAVWTTYRQAGARFMVVSGQVETTELRAAYTSALAECDVQMVRLGHPRAADRGADPRHPWAGLGPRGCVGSGRRASTDPRLHRAERPGGGAGGG